MAESKGNNCCVKKQAKGLTKVRKSGIIKAQKLASLANKFG